MAKSELRFPVSANSALTNVASSIANITLLASNAARLGAVIVNDSNSRLFVKFGATASTTSYTRRLAPHETFDITGYTGIIDGLWAPNVSGSARVTELTP